MLTPDYLRKQPQHIADIYLKLENQILSDVSKGIAKNLKLTEDTEYRLRIMQEMGYDLKKIEKEIAKTTKISEKEIDGMLRSSSELSYNDDRKRYKEGGKSLPSIDNNPKMIDFIESIIKQTKGSMRNLSNAMGFIDNGKFKVIDSFYKDTLDYAIFQTGSGAYSYQDAIYQAVKKLGDSGIRTIDYSSGRAYHIESAVRMNVLTGLSQITNGMSMMNVEMMGAEHVEVSAHSGARTGSGAGDHSSWQGKIYSMKGDIGKYEDFEEATGYGTGEGLGGYNCRHSFFPYFEGVSKPAYTEKQLEELEGKDIVFDEKEYTHYQATQKMRQLERNIRHIQRQLIVFEDSGLKDRAIATKIRLKGQADLYTEFSNVAGIRPKFDRVRVYRKDD